MNKSTRGVLRIGTSNIVVPGTKQSFPPAFQNKSRLQYYSSLFKTVELNSTFYKVPMAKTFEKWSLDVADEFQFTIKLWKQITHVKKIAFNSDDVDHFLATVNHLTNKKGCLLIQFPGSITVDYSSEVEQLFRRLKKQDTKNTWHKAVEFRDSSWYGNYTFSLLDKYGISIVVHDKAKSENIEVNAGATFMYCRFHGPAGNYRGTYTNEYLKQYAIKIQGWLDDGKDVYAYFNNTMGNAFENAVTLREIVKG